MCPSTLRVQRILSSYSPLSSPPATRAAPSPLLLCPQAPLPCVLPYALTQALIPIVRRPPLYPCPLRRVKVEIVLCACRHAPLFVGSIITVTHVSWSSSSCLEGHCCARNVFLDKCAVVFVVVSSGRAPPLLPSVRARLSQSTNKYSPHQLVSISVQWPASVIPVFNCHECLHVGVLSTVDCSAVSFTLLDLIAVGPAKGGPRFLKFHVCGKILMLRL